MIPTRVSRGPSNLLLEKTLPLGKCYASTESKAWWLFSAQINRRWSKLLFDTLPMKLLDQTWVRIECGIDQLTFQACPFKLHHLSHSAADKRVTLNWKKLMKTSLCHKNVFNSLSRPPRPMVPGYFCELFQLFSNTKISALYILVSYAVVQSVSQSFKLA